MDRPPRGDGEDDRSSPELSKPRWRPHWLLAAVLAVLAVYHFSSQRDLRDAERITYTQFVDLVEGGAVSEVELRGDAVRGELATPTTVDDREVKRFETRVPAQVEGELIERLGSHEVEVEALPQEETTAWSVIGALLPWVLIIGAWLWVSRALRSGGAIGRGGPLSQLMKGRAKRFDPEQDVRVTMADVAGLTAAKRDLEEVVEFLREPERFERLGVEAPRGILLAGKPGVGKTLLARAVAGEANVPFFSVAGSDFIELFVGVGASRVRELFEASKKAGPSIVFIDEIDAVGRARGTGLGGGHDEREQTLNQLLHEMDGFTPNDRTIVIAATNRPDVLDAALLRPGRFDRRVMLDLPALPARKAILAVHVRDKPVHENVDLEALAAATPGFSGADLANLVNEAAMATARRRARIITREDFDAAFDKVVLGNEREMILSEEERQRIAVHESGHAIVALRTKGASPPRRVSIIPRGASLGSTQQRPEADRYVVAQPEIIAKLRVLLGGYAAEKLTFDAVSTGAEDDLKKATELAQRMVTSYGMSQALGPVRYELMDEHPFLGRRAASGEGMSDQTRRIVETEVQALLTQALEEATRCLERTRGGLDQLAEALLEEESIADERLDALLERVDHHEPLQIEPESASGDEMDRAMHASSS